MDILRVVKKGFGLEPEMAGDGGRGGEAGHLAHSGATLEGGHRLRGVAQSDRGAAVPPCGPRAALGLEQQAASVIGEPYLAERGLDRRFNGSN